MLQLPRRTALGQGQERRKHCERPPSCPIPTRHWGVGQAFRVTRMSKMSPEHLTSPHLSSACSQPAGCGEEASQARTHETDRRWQPERGGTERQQKKQRWARRRGTGRQRRQKEGKQHKEKVARTKPSSKEKGKPNTKPAKKAKSIFSASLIHPVLKRPPEAPHPQKGPPGAPAVNRPPWFPHSRVLITMTQGLIHLVPKGQRWGGVSFTSFFPTLQGAGFPRCRVSPSEAS